MAELNGRHYRAVRRISNAADETLADVGETCERVPSSALQHLLASGGRIEPVPPPPDTSRALKSEEKSEP